MTGYDPQIGDEIRVRYTGEKGRVVGLPLGTSHTLIQLDGKRETQLIDPQELELLREAKDRT